MIDCRVGYCCVVGALSFATPVRHWRAYFSNRQSIIRQTNNCYPSENTVSFFLNRYFSFSNRVYCTCAPFPALIMFYLSIMFIDFDDYCTDSSVSPLFPILTALWTTKRTLGRLESISISSPLVFCLSFLCSCLYTPTYLCSFARTS